MAKFDAETLGELRDVREVAIRTDKHPKSAVVIWVVVATLEFAGHRLGVQAFTASDAASIERASHEFLRKYQASPYAQSIVRAEILPTTLRLEPR